MEVAFGHPYYGWEMAMAFDHQYRSQQNPCERSSGMTVDCEPCEQTS